MTHEFKLYLLAKEITDSKKLANMLPKWIKKHQNSVKPPKPFVFIPGLPPQFPPGCKGCPLGYVAPQEFKLPSAYITDLKKYIEEFDTLNNLKRI